MKNRIIPVLATIGAGVIAVGAVAVFAPDTSAMTYIESATEDFKTILTPSSTNNSNKNKTNTTQKPQLATPTDFTIDEDGNYSFKGVDGAGYYIIQFYQSGKDGDEDDYLFMSSPIEATEAETYSGNCQDLFHYAFLNYTAKLFAYPAMGDSSYTVSSSVTYAYNFSGAIDAPEISYFYNANTQKIEFILNNIETSYYYQAYPDTVNITLVNEGTGKSETLTIDGVSAENYTLSYDIPEKGSYSVTTYATSTNSAVTNAQTETVTVASSLDLSNKNKLSENYYLSADNYSDTVKSLYSSSWGWWPLLCESFNLTESSVAGRAIGRKGDFNTKVDTTPMTSVSELTESQAAYKAEIEAKLGYTGNVQYVYSTITNFNNANVIPAGNLFLYDDGSMLLIVGYTSAGPLKAGYLHGSWVANGDGTATLNYNPSDNISA